MSANEEKPSTPMEEEKVAPKPKKSLKPKQSIKKENKPKTKPEANTTPKEEEKQVEKQEDKEGKEKGYNPSMKRGARFKKQIKGNPVEEHFDKIMKKVAPYNPKGTVLEEITQAFSEKKTESVNKVLSASAQDRNYGKAIYIYKKMIADGVKENLYTISALFNTAARVGDGELIEATWQRMKQLGFKANEVIRTIVIKGYFTVSEVEKAMYTYYCMEKRGNVRAVNVVLRGLLRYGNAGQIHTFSKHELSVTDTTTIDYLIALYSIEFDLPNVRKIVEKIQSEDDVSPSSLINLAALNCLNGDVDGAEILLREFEEVSKKKPTDVRKSIKLFKKHQVSQLRNRRKYIRQYITAMNEVPREERKKYQFNNSKYVIQLYPRKTEVIDFNKIFGNDNPINLELCSGYGEWLVNKAVEMKTENWVGVEICRDRSYCNWSSSVFAGLNNVACIWGDVMSVMMMCLNPDTISNIFLNFPEPPEFEESPTNLFTSQLFFHIARVLKPNGCFYLLTDSKVVVTIVEKVFTHTPILRTKFKYQHDKMFKNQMPKDYGTSYFDQLFKNANTNEDRYFLKIEKN